MTRPNDLWFFALVLFASFAVGAACGSDGVSGGGVGGGMGDGVGGGMGDGSGGGMGDGSGGGMGDGSGGGGGLDPDGGAGTGGGMGDGAGGGMGDGSGGGGATVTGDGMPKDAVSFFDATECPDGWSTYSFANGRAIVPTSVGAENRTHAGTVLSSTTPRTHRHTLASSVSIPGVGFVLVDGCCNNSPGDDGTYSVSATTSSTDTGVPYAFFLVCRKTVDPEPAAPAPPTGMFSYFDGASCPAGWGDTTALSGDDGRFVVGLPSGGPNGATFGGPPLADGSLPTHSHAASGSISTSSTGITGASSGSGGYAKNGTYGFSTTTSSSTEDFPYIQLLRCKKL
jgi:hypothetical protein